MDELNLEGVMATVVNLADRRADMEAEVAEHPGPQYLKARSMVRDMMRATVGLAHPESYGAMLEGQCQGLAVLAHETGISLERVISTLRMEYSAEAKLRSSDP